MICVIKICTVLYNSFSVVQLRIPLPPFGGQWIVIGYRAGTAQGEALGEGAL